MRGKKTVKGVPCCWHCERCEGYNYQVDELSCELCPLDQRPNVNRTGCQLIPIIKLEWHSPKRCARVHCHLGNHRHHLCDRDLVRYNDTPIVRASAANLVTCSSRDFSLLFNHLFDDCSTRYHHLLLPRIFLGLHVCHMQHSWPKQTESTEYLSRGRNLSQHLSLSVLHPSWWSPFSLISIQLLGVCVWFVVDPPHIIIDYGEQRTLDPENAQRRLGVTSLISRSFVHWGTVFSWWLLVLSMPLKQEEFQRLSMKPNLLDSPCTPPASFG